MQEASQAPIVANGELRLSKIISQETNRMVIGNKGAAVAEYLFTGSLSDKSGKRDVKDAKLRISTSCIASWCGRLPEENSSGYFLFKSEEKVGLTLSIGACTFQPFSVTGKQATELEACATPEPVVVKPQPPKEVKPKAGSQIFSQDQTGKSLVK
jgi:hypothetical protein